MNPGTMHADRREFSRIDLEDAPRTIQLDGPDGGHMQAELLDISLGGMRIRIPEGLGNLSGWITMCLENLQARAEIVWSTATEIGLRYLEAAGATPITILEHILKSQIADSRLYGNVVPLFPE